MPKRNITIYYDVVENTFRDVDGVAVISSTLPYIYYKENVDVTLHLVTDGEAPGTVFSDLDSASSFGVSVDYDFANTTSPMCLTGNVDITIVSSGVFTFPLDANTAAFLTAIGTSAEKKSTKLELRAYDISGTLIGVVQMNFRAFNIIDSTGIPPEISTDAVYTKDESDARFARKWQDQGNWKFDGPIFKLWNPDRGMFVAVGVSGPAGAQMVVPLED
jgi:hypothetical protein